MLIIVMDGIFLAGMHWQQERELAARFTATAERMTEVAHYAMNNALTMLRPMAILMAEDGTVRKMVHAAMDANQRGHMEGLKVARNTLHAYVQDGWNTWQSEQQFRQMHFVLPDGQSLLRMQQPDAHGDNLAAIRPMLMASMAGQRVLSGYEYGRLYGGFRAAAPVLDHAAEGKSRVLGVVEVGLSGEGIFQGMAAHFGIQSAVIINRDHTLSHLDEQRRQTAQASQLKGCANCHLDTSTDLGAAQILEQLGDAQDYAEWTLMPLGGANMLVTALPLHDFQGQSEGLSPIGRILLWKNVDTYLSEGAQEWKSLLLANLAWLSITLAATYLLMLKAHGWLERRIEQQTSQISALLAESREEANVDPLTLCRNRRYLMQRIEEHIATHERHGHVFSILMIDIDHFKEVNDRHGHLCGDEILRQVAEILKRLSRTSDVTARYGGEEFCILLPNSTLEGARLLAERFRLEVVRARQGLQCAQGWPLAISIGVAEHRAGEDKDDLLQRADDALYASKHNDRNRVSLG